MGAHQRNKGKRTELLILKELQKLLNTTDGRRAQQFDGKLSPDLCGILPGVAVEVKGYKSVPLADFIHYHGRTGGVFIEDLEVGGSPELMVCGALRQLPHHAGANCRYLPLGINGLNQIGRWMQKADEDALHLQRVPLLVIKADRRTPIFVAYRKHGEHLTSALKVYNV
jgi:hypothetical protein